MKAVWTIARRELRALFDQPIAYILLIVFVGINNFLYFRQAFVYGVATLRPMLEMLPWLLLFFVPGVTMRSLAEDIGRGTIEIVLAQPLNEFELLLGKFLGQVLFVWTALALTLAIPMGLSLGADLHVGVVIAQYVGAALLAMGMVGVGVWASSQTRNQVTAFIIAVTVLFFLILLGLDPLLLGLPPALGGFIARLSVLPHFRDIARGVIDLRDIIYFVTLAAIFLSLAYAALMRRKLSPAGEARKKLRLGVAMLVAALIVVNLFGRVIGGRLDLTPGKAYTLSRATRDIVRNVDDLITIKLFVSKDLPPEVAMLRRDIDDLLRDYRSAGDGNVRLVIRDPADDEEASSEAQSLGIPAIQFNVMGESQFTVRDGYLGLAVQYADESEVIPFIQRTEDLEYRLTSFVKGMTDTSKVAVGYYVDPSETQLPGSSFNVFRQALAETYEVRSLSFAIDTILPPDMGVVVLIGSPDSLSADQAAQFRSYLQRGGGALIMAGGMALGQQQFAMGREVAWNEVLEPFGVSIPTNMVYDLLANERVRMPTNFGMSIFRPYPLWLRAMSTQANAVNQGIESLFLPWASSIDTSGIAEGTLIPLFVTSQAGGVEETAVMLDPSRSFPQDSLDVQLLAALVNPSAVDEEATLRGRVAVVGTARLMVDQYVQNNAQSPAFGLNVVDWLAQDDALIAIRAKDRRPPTLVFSSELKASVVKWFNIAGIPLLVALAGVLRLMRRRQRTRRRYVRAPAGATI